MLNPIVQFLQDEEGATALEYGLLAALIAAAIIGAVTTLGSTVSNTFQSRRSLFLMDKLQHVIHHSFSPFGHIN